MSEKKHLDRDTVISTILHTRNSRRHGNEADKALLAVIEAVGLPPTESPETSDAERRHQETLAERQLLRAVLVQQGKDAERRHVALLRGIVFVTRGDSVEPLEKVLDVIRGGDRS